jgi:DNA polymerase
MLVGEQPGDAEDQAGVPFVGPAGRVLDETLREAGLDRAEIYVTNAVKHFKWEPRGKRRLHKRPSTSEVVACKFWLTREIAGLHPRVIVALGATAARAILGKTVSIAAARGRAHLLEDGCEVRITYHPSAVLRADAGAARIRTALITDLRQARMRTQALRNW